MAGILKEQPPHTLEVLFGIEGQDYCIYLADERELATARGLPDGDNIDRGAGQPISGHVKLDLPAGDYQAACFDPQTGLYSPAIQVPVAGSGSRLTVPTFAHDLVMRVTRS